MENLCLKIMNKNMEALAVARGENEVNLVYAGEYQEGDIIILEVSEGSHYAWLQWDDAIGKSLVYLTGNVTYKIPFGDRRINLSPKAFSGKKHLLSVKLAKEFDVSQSALARYEIDDSTPSPEVFLKYADYFDVSLDYIFGRTDDPHGMIYNNCVKLGLNNPEMARFVEMCFDPGSVMNERLKDTLVRMLSEVKQ